MSSTPTPDLSGLRQAFPYPRSEPGATTVLEEELVREISKNGPLSFQDYMARCLYHPELGYYSRPAQPTVSKDGDFMTSVSVGPCFGHLLAQRLFHFWKSNGSPEDFVIAEIGAHDGTLAQDIRSSLPAELAEIVRYVIVEPLTSRRALLAEKFGDSVQIIEKAERIGEIGALVANEVLDALPVPIILFESGNWHEVAVGLESQLEWTTFANLSPDLKTFSEQLGTDFPNGYVTEGPPSLKQFFSDLLPLFDSGMFTFVDYGLDQENLYSTSRTVGTFRCYRQHRSNCHPLDHPGEQDLTADVNFTASEKEAQRLGLTAIQPMNQSRYLTHCAKQWLVSKPPPSTEELRQFQTLIHPTQFGSRFYVQELLKGEVNHGFP